MSSRSTAGALALLLLSCAPDGDVPGPPRATGRAELAWAEVLAFEADPDVVADAGWRERIAATGLPWHVRDRASGIEMLLVPPGEFRRGASAGDEEAYDDERPAHRVRVPEPFYLGRFEVTQAEWRHVMDEDPSHFTGEPRRPVEQVDRLVVGKFLEQTGLALPTEGEWEYACRAGDTRPRYGPLDDVAWSRGTAGSTTHVVGEKRANALGFHDLLGNVWEWTDTWYEADFYARCTDGVSVHDGPPGGLHAVLRGGSWYDAPARLRASARYRAMWNFAAGHVGLRVSRTP